MIKLRISRGLYVITRQQEGELSPELYNFHEVVSQLQQQEDEVLDFHKDLLDLQERWMSKDLELLNSTREVDYDQDGEFICY